MRHAVTVAERTTSAAVDRLIGLPAFGSGEGAVRSVSPDHMEGAASGGAGVVAATSLAKGRLSVDLEE